MTEQEILKLVSETLEKWQEVKDDRFAGYTVKSLADDILTACRKMKDHIDDNGLEL